MVAAFGQEFDSPQLHIVKHDFKDKKRDFNY